MSPHIQFEKVGGSLQPIVRTAADVIALLDLPPAYWSITSIAIDAIAMDPEFLKFIDDDDNGKIRVDEVKRAIQWMKDRMKNLNGVEKKSDVLVLADLNTDAPEARNILDSATLALKNTGIANPETISLADISDRRKLIAAGLSNGDGVIPVSMLEDPRLIPIAAMIVKLFGAVKDASGADGFNEDALKKFTASAQAYIKWMDEPAGNPAILPFQSDTGTLYNAYLAVSEALDRYFESCAALRMFGEKKDTALDNLLDTGSVADALKKAPAAMPDKSNIFSRRADLNPLWRDAIENFFNLVLPDQDTLSAEEWIAIKKKFAPFGAWKAAKPSDLFDGEDHDILRAAIKNRIPQKLQEMIDEDRSCAKEIDGFEDVRKLILYQKNLLKFLNNYVNLRILFASSVDSILQAGILVMDGRCFKLATRVASIADHKAIATRSNICTMYIDAQTGKKDALRKMQLAVAVTSGDMYDLFVGKYGVFFTPDGTVWDAKVVDYIQQPVSFSEALKMPFYRFGVFIGKQVDKFFSAQSKEFEQGFDKTMTQAQNFKPAAAPAAKVQTPAVSGSMMLMGGGIGLAAMGSAVAFIAQSLKNVSFWNVLGVFLVIMLIFGGPMVAISLVKLYRRNIAVFLEAGGLALNKRMRLSRVMGKIFTDRPAIPGNSLADKTDVVRTLFQKQLDSLPETAKSSFRWLKILFWLLFAAAFGAGCGLLLWHYLLNGGFAA